MKLWAVVAVCVLLLSSVSNSPLPAGWETARKPSFVSEKEEEDQIPVLLQRLSRDPSPSLPEKVPQAHSKMADRYPDRLDDVVEYIEDTLKRLKRSSDRQNQILSKRDRNRQNAAASNVDTVSKKTGKDRRLKKNRGCVLKEIHLNVTDLDLGYDTKEELIFRYCSGSCNTPETTYDQIVKNLTRNKKFANDKVKQACCRPIAFDDDLAFLDDNLVYHTLKQHSARKCGCV